MNKAPALTKRVGSLMSAPSRAISSLRGRRADSARKVLKTARAYDNAPNFDDKGQPTNAFKTRVLADKIRSKPVK